VVPFTQASGNTREALPILDEALLLQGPSHDTSHIGTLRKSRRHASAPAIYPVPSSPCRMPCTFLKANSAPKASSPDARYGHWAGFDFNKAGSAKAKDMFVQSLTILESGNAPQTDISSLLDDSAKVYTRGQQWALGKQTYERALEIDRRVLGDDHPRVAAILENLAIVEQNMGDLKQAETLVPRRAQTNAKRLRRAPSRNCD